MTKDIFAKILAERGARQVEGTLSIADAEIATLLLGGQAPTTLTGVVAFVLDDDVLVVTTRKGSTTYVEYGSVLGVTFEPRALAERRTGF